MRLWAAVLLEVDKAHPVAVRARCRAVARRGGVVLGRRRCEADFAHAACGGGELTSDLGVCAGELLGPQPDVRGERFCLSLAGGAVCWGSAVGVGDRQVLSDRESRVLRVFDTIKDSPLGGADVAGAVAGDPRCLP